MRRRLGSVPDARLRSKTDDFMKDSIKKIEKVVINSGVGKLSSLPNFNDKVLPGVIKDFSIITGQKPSTRPVKKSIAGFKIREGMTVGLVATLRGKRMIAFIDKLIKLVFPRIRDFRGLALSGIDGQGNLNIGIRENFSFPEISQDVTKANFGIQITIVPKSIKNRDEAIDIYKDLGIPFEKEHKSR